MDLVFDQVFEHFVVLFDEHSEKECHVFLALDILFELFVVFLPDEFVDAFFKVLFLDGDCRADLSC